MSRRIGIIGRAFENFKNSLSAPKLKTTLVGTDHQGNKFFEKEGDESRNLRGARWIETADGDQWTVPQVSPEWDSWLRGRRKHPPTPEELERNYAVMMRTKHRARELEEKEAMIGAASTQESSAREKSYTSTVDPDEGQNKTKFPVYPDYEIQPGEMNTSKHKK